MAIHDKNRREFHPAVSILSWLIFALAVELASPYQLMWIVLPAILMLSRRKAALRFMRLIWRTRWLWLALISLYAWTMPGTLVWSSEYSPSLEGLLAGLERVARLVLLLAALARLLSEFTPRQMAGGIYLLARPLVCLGLDRRALAVRLALTIEHMEHSPKGRNWLDELQTHPSTLTGPEEIRLTIAPVGLKDTLMLFSVVALLGIVLLKVAT